jgi:sirohydrochlorin cobaltochelatase
MNNGDYSKSALLIVGHGSTQNPDSSEPSLVIVEELRSRNIFKEVVACFWKEEPSMREIYHMIDSDSIFVVPNFISEGYFTKTVIPRELNLTGALTQVGNRSVRYCEPTGNHRLMTDLLLKRAKEVAPGVPTEETSLLIVGHGTNLNDNSAVAAKFQASVIQDRGIYGEVLNTYMEEEPLISKWDTLTKHPNVVVVPFFISDGLHSFEDIPVLLGIAEESPGAASKQTMFRRNPYHLRDRTLFYAGAIGTEPGFAEIILDQVRSFDDKRVNVVG